MTKISEFWVAKFKAEAYFIWRYNVSKGWSLKCRQSKQSDTGEQGHVSILFLDVPQDLIRLVRGT